LLCHLNYAAHSPLSLIHLDDSMWESLMTLV
jgi:hypothetical protein